MFIRAYLPSSSQMALQSNADLCLLNGLLPVSSVFRPVFPVFNITSMNIGLYTVPPFFLSYNSLPLDPNCSQFSPVHVLFKKDFIATIFLVLVGMSIKITVLTHVMPQSLI